jgi:hypothetical protein
MTHSMPTVVTSRMPPTASSALFAAEGASFSSAAVADNWTLFRNSFQSRGARSVWGEICAKYGARWLVGALWGPILFKETADSNVHRPVHLTSPSGFTRLLASASPMKPWPFGGSSAMVQSPKNCGPQDLLTCPPICFSGANLYELFCRVSSPTLETQNQYRSYSCMRHCCNS